MKSNNAATSSRALLVKPMLPVELEPRGRATESRATDAGGDTGAKASKEISLVDNSKSGTSSAGIIVMNKAKAPPSTGARRAKVMKSKNTATSSEVTSAKPVTLGESSGLATAATSSRSKLVGRAMRPDQLHFQHPTRSYGTTLEDREEYKTKGEPVINPESRAASTPCIPSRQHLEGKRDFFERRTSGEVWKRLQKPENKALRVATSGSTGSCRVKRG